MAKCHDIKDSFADILSLLHGHHSFNCKDHWVYNGPVKIYQRSVHWSGLCCSQTMLQSTVDHLQKLLPPCPHLAPPQLQTPVHISSAHHRTLATMSIHYHQINSLLLMIANPWGSKVQVNKMPQTNQVDQVQLVQCVHHVLQVGHGHHC